MHAHADVLARAEHFGLVDGCDFARFSRQWLRRAIKAAAIFGILNWLLGQFIFVVLGIATLGIGFLLAFLTRWFVMALLPKFADALSSNFKIDSSGTAVLGALLMSGIGTLAEYGIRTLS